MADLAGPRYVVDACHHVYYFDNNDDHHHHHYLPFASNIFLFFEDFGLLFDDYDEDRPIVGTSPPLYFLLSSSSSSSSS